MPSAPSRSELRAGTLVRYAVGSIGTGGFATLPGLVLVYFLTDTLGVAAIAAGLLVTLAKVWDVLIDPIIGARSDRGRAATGNRRRLMVLGALLLPVFFVLTFAVPAGLGPVISGAWVFVAFVASATAFSFFQVPYIALPAELVDSYDARTRLLSARVVVLAFAILLFGAGGPSLRRLGGDDEHLGYLLMAVVAGLVLGIALYIAAGVEKSARRGATPAAPTADAPFAELPAPRATLWDQYKRAIQVVRGSQPFRALLATFVLQALATGMMLAGAQYIATWVLSDETAVDILFASLIAPALLFTPVWAVVARRIGKERTFVITSVLFGLAALSLIGLIWAPGPWVYGPVALAGAAYAGLQSLPMSMLPDVVAYDSRANGPGRAGTFGGVWTASETAGMAFGTTVLTIVLAVSGYVESVAGQDVTQPDSALAGIVLSFSVVPAVMVALSLITLARYPLRKDDIDVDATLEAAP